LLDAYQRRRVAAWAFLKGIILQYTGKVTVVPEAHVREFVHRRQPPMKSAMWMAEYGQPFALTTFRASGGGFRPPDRGDVYVLTWSVGTLSFHIFGQTSPNTYGHSFGDAERWLTPIWPAGGLVRRPPDGHFDDAGIGRLHESLQANITDEVRAQRDRGIAEYIKSSLAERRPRT
jgi:hypothetical protein